MVITKQIMAKTQEKTYCLYFILIQSIIEVATEKNSALMQVGPISRKNPW